MKKLTDIKTAELQVFLGCSKSRASQIINGHVRLSASLSQKINKKYGIPLWEMRPDIYPRYLFEAKNEE